MRARVQLRDTEAAREAGAEVRVQAQLREVEAAAGAASKALRVMEAEAAQRQEQLPTGRQPRPACFRTEMKCKAKEHS